MGLVVPVVSGIVLFFVIRISSGVAVDSQDMLMPTPTTNITQADLSSVEYEYNDNQNSLNEQSGSNVQNSSNGQNGTTKQDEPTIQENTEIIETGPKYTTIDAPVANSKTQKIDSMKPNTTAIGNTTILTYSGNLTTDGQRDIYTIKAPYDGNCRLDIGGMQSGTEIGVFVYDELGEVVASNNYCSNGEGVTITDAQKGKAYEIQIRQKKKSSSYTLTVGLPKDAVDISGITYLTDSIEYTAQRNVYYFTAPVDGRYRLDFSKMQSGTEIGVFVYDELGEVVASNNYCSNGEGVTITDAKAGNRYMFQLRQKNKFSSFDMSIGYQKETVNITGLTLLTDSIEYTDQRNLYTFTAPLDGRYRLDFSKIQSGTEIGVFVYDELGEVVASNNYCSNGEGVTVTNVKAGKVYMIQVRQKNKFSSFDLLIGYQKETIKVEENTIVHAGITHTDEQNTYLFTATTSGDISITMSGMEHGAVVKLYVFNDLNETMASDTNCTNDESIMVKGVKAGEQYVIQVRQSKGITQYTLTID